MIVDPGRDTGDTSEQNVEIVRRALEAALRRPKPDYDTMNALYHPDHELITGIQRLEGGVAEGARGFRDYLTTMDEAWERWDLKAGQVRSIDADRVLIKIMVTSLSKRAGAELELLGTAIVTVRAGKLARTEFYDSPEQAEAAGVSE